MTKVLFNCTEIAWKYYFKMSFNEYYLKNNSEFKSLISMKK